MGNRLGILAFGVLVGAAAMYGTATEAQMPAKKAFNGVVKPIGPVHRRRRRGGRGGTCRGRSASIQAAGSWSRGVPRRRPGA